jgi:hypothetical protein
MVVWFRLKGLFPVLFLLLAATASSFGQDVGGTIFGSVHDHGGAVLGDAGVEIRNIATGEVMNLVTNGQGEFSAPSLRVGTYAIRASHNGFKTTVQNNIVLQIGANVTANLTLEIGSAMDSVTVTSEQPAMNTVDAALGTVIESRSIEELPLNGRNTLALVLLTPGVRSLQPGNVSGFADRGSALSNISINGSPSGANGNLLDGANNLQSYTGELSINPTVDAIQEFVVLSGTLSSEYGFTAGGIVNMSTRSGTNKYHGTAYEFLRNDAFDARNYFLPKTSTKPVLRYNQFGGALGGPIRRDKMFFFGNYEEFQYNAPTVQTGTVPTLLQRKGDFSQTFGTNGVLIPIYDPTTTAPCTPATCAGSTSGYTRKTFPGNKITMAEDPVAAAIQNYYPLPNRVSPVASDQITNSNNYLTVASNHRWMKQGTGRVDAKISDRNSMFGRYSYYQFFTDNGGTSIYTDPLIALRNDTTTSQSGIFADTYTFSSSLINEFRVAANRTYFQFATPSFGGGWPQKLGLPAIVPNQTFPQISGNGEPAFQTTAGVRAVTNPQVLDTIIWLKGRHSLKFGIDWQWNRGNNFQTFNPPVQYNFASQLTGQPNSPGGTGSGYASFYLGDVTSAAASVNGYEAERNIIASGFVQDDWKATSYLTLNFGLRYDYQQQPVEAANGISNFNPYMTDPISGLLGSMEYASSPGQPRSYRNEDFKDFGPRAGFSWDLTHDGKTSLRGGYGIYYVSTFNTLFFGSTTAYSSLATSYAGADTNYPAFQLQTGLPYAPAGLLGPKLGTNGQLGQNPTYDQSNGAVPMSQQYNLSIQRTVPGGVVVEAIYVGNHGTHMITGQYNMDALNPEYFYLGNALQNQVPNPYAGKIPGAYGGPTISKARSLLAYPYYASINVRNPHDGNFHSDALELTAKKHMNSGLTMLATYTMSKLLDDSIASATGFGANTTLVASNGYQNPFNRAAEYALDPADVSQRATVAVMYDLPFGHGKRFGGGANGLENALIGGWQVNGIGTFQTGTPVLIQGANNNEATRPNFVPGVNPKLSHPTLSAWFNTAAFINPPLYTFGNVPRTLGNVRAPGYDDIDFSLFKTTPLYRSVALQIRVEAFDVLNHPGFGLPNGGFSPGANGLNSSGSFGEVTSANNSRVLQLGAKLNF